MSTESAGNPAPQPDAPASDAPQIVATNPTGQSFFEPSAPTDPSKGQPEAKTEAKPWSEQFPNDKDGTQVWEAFQELRKKLSSGEHKKESTGLPAEVQQQINDLQAQLEESNKKSQKYQMEEMRAGANKEFSVDWDQNQWVEFAKDFEEGRTPDQIRIVREAFQNGMYEIVAPYVEAYKNKSSKSKDPAPTLIGASPFTRKGGNDSGNPEKGFSSPAELQEFISKMNYNDSKQVDLLSAKMKATPSNLKGNDLQLSRQMKQQPLMPGDM